MKEYYNVLDSGYKVFSFGAAGLGMIAVIILIIIFNNQHLKRFQRIIRTFTFGLAIFWTALAFIIAGSEYFSCINAMKNGTYKEVEGIVENFDPMPHSGHKEESFTVNGVKFEYSDYTITAGFNNSKSHGGPIDQGKYVRIKYHKGIILQLWVKE